MANKYAEAHQWENLAGPGDARPTAIQIIQDEGLTGKLADKVILITGINSGIGLEAMKTLATTGATIYGTVRDVEQSRHILDSFPSANVHFLTMSLDSLASVRAAATEFLAATGGKLNVLISNAGVMATPEGRTADGFETQLGINHLGHFLLFCLLQNALLASATSDFPSRVVTLTSSGHRITDHINFENINLSGAYDPWVAYGQSKLANIYMANEVERRFGSRGLHGWSVNPGGINTPLYRFLPEETLRAFDNPDNDKLRKSPEQGAATTVWAATAAELNGKGGRYLEDCGIVTKTAGFSVTLQPGVAPWAYSPENERRLWEISEEMVGLKG